MKTPMAKASAVRCGDSCRWRTCLSSVEMRPWSLQSTLTSVDGNVRNWCTATGDAGRRGHDHVKSRPSRCDLPNPGQRRCCCAVRPFESSALSGRYGEQQFIILSSGQREGSPDPASGDAHRSGRPGIPGGAPDRCPPRHGFPRRCGGGRRRGRLKYRSRRSPSGLVQSHRPSANARGWTQVPADQEIADVRSARSARVPCLAARCKSLKSGQGIAECAGDVEIIARLRTASEQKPSRG